MLVQTLSILNTKQIEASYGHYIVLLILGAFFVVKAIEMNNLHKRIALATIKVIGTSRSKVMLSFMIATEFLSNRTSNNSTALMMLPIGLAITAREKEMGADTKRFSPASMLSIAYSASIGGTGTLAGTPPNLVFVRTAQELLPNSPDILFTDWLKIGVHLLCYFYRLRGYTLLSFLKYQEI